MARSLYEGFVSKGLVGYTNLVQKWAKQVEKNPDGNYEPYGNLNIVL